MEKVIIVGGGPAGLTAALMASQKGKEVYLIEEEAECGGLLRSFTNREGVVFDYGSHFLRQTGNKALDELVFGEFEDDVRGWQRVPFLKNGTYFNGQLYEKSPYINANFLPKALYEKGITELSDLHPPKAEDCKNCEEYVLKTFGPTFLESLFRPAMTKFYDSPMNELIPLAHHFFDMNRILAYTPKVSRELKKSPEMDARIGFHFSDEGLASVMNYYPSTGGIGKWVARLTERVKSYGGNIICNARVEKIYHKDREIRSVTLSNGERLDCDLLVWSVVPFPLLKASGLTFETHKIKMRTSNMYFYVFDRPLDVECQYFVCFDAKYKAFRISSYANYRSRPADKAIYAVCVEVLDHEPNVSEAATDSICNELIEMGLLESRAKVLFKEARTARAGFPVITNAFLQQNASLSHFINQQFDNLILSGKGAGGKVFFTHETLLDTFNAMNARL